MRGVECESAHQTCKRCLIMLYNIQYSKNAFTLKICYLDMILLWIAFKHVVSTWFWDEHHQTWLACLLPIYCTVSVLAQFLELGSHKSGFMKVVAEESRDGGKFIREYAKPCLPGVLPIQTRFVNSTSKYSWCGYRLWSRINNIVNTSHFWRF